MIASTPAPAPAHAHAHAHAPAPASAPAPAPGAGAQHEPHGAGVPAQHPRGGRDGSRLGNWSVGGSRPTWCAGRLAQPGRGVAAVPWHPPHPPTPQGVDCAGGAVNFSCFSNYI